MLNLDQIKKQLSEISPWPWKLVEDKNDYSIHSSGESGRDYEDNFLTEVARVWIGNYDYECHYSEKEDAAFIAQAPTIISELVKEIEELRKENFAQKGKLIEASLCLTMNRPSEEYLDWVETAMPENVRGTLVQQQMNIDDCLQKLSCTSNPKEGR